MFINDLSPTLFKAILKASDGATAPPLFAKGEIVEGTVTKSLSPNQAMVRLGGVEMLAQTKIQLMDGQSITGMVEKTAPLTVNLLQGKATADEKIAELVRLLLPEKKPMADALTAVTQQANKSNLPPVAKEAMQALAPKLAEAVVKDLAALTPEGTKTAIKQSGLFFEASLKEAAQAPKGERPAKVAQTIATDIKGRLATTLKTLEGEIARLTKELATPLPGRNNPAAPAPAAPALPTATLTADTKVAPPLVANEPPSKGDTAKPPPSPGGAPPKPAQAIIDPRLEMLALLRESARSVREALHTIELNQLMNHGATPKEGAQATAPNLPPFLFQLPFAEGGLIKNAKVYVDPDGGGGNVRDKKKGETAVVFMLDMSLLGPVRVDTRVAKEQIAGSVYVGTDQVAAYLEGRLPDLVGPLTEAGYQVTFDVRVASSAKLTEELESFVPLTPQGLINVKA